jgi:hypothetical protein
VLFHFQYRCEDRWEDMGSGEGEGIRAPLSALADLNELSGDGLPVGIYRCIPARADSAYWEHLVIHGDGTMGFGDGEPAEDGAGTPADRVSVSVRAPHPV